MPEFSYIALTKDGRKEASTITAPSQAAAGHLLKEQGLLPTQIQEKHAGRTQLQKRHINSGFFFI
jgi:type II secretory pathway component PulF